MQRSTHAIATTLICTLATLAAGDVVKFTNGTVIENCYVLDEGVRIGIWKSVDDVSDPPAWYPRSEIKEWNYGRNDDVWDAKPQKADLTVTFIEINPKLAGLHGRVQYDKFGRAWVAGPSEKLIELPEDEKYTQPEKAVANLKLAYEEGEELTLTAHVKNIGFKTSRPFRVEWLINDRPFASERYTRPLAEMEVATFSQKYAWQPGRHTVTVRVVSDQNEITKRNNEVTDALWAFSFTYVVSHGRVDAWHDFRSAYGTYSFEDFYRWHLDIMNLLFEHSVYPAAPDGIQARVRLDRIIYADQVKNNTPIFAGKPQSLFRDDGIRYDQGGWIWNDNDQELETGNFVQVNPEWRNRTEWSLPHELGHQLGLVDWYAIDYGGADHHTWPDNNEKVTHFQQYPEQMMHWHGPQPFGEVDAGYLNATIDKPRGYYGDFYFQNPQECFLHITDINGVGVPHATVEIFQRGCKVDTGKAPGEQQGVKFYHVIEDGDFYSPPTSRHPVIAGKTDELGVLRLPNRPAAECRTLNGYHRTDNPWGNMNVVGPRNLMMVKVTRHDREMYFWLEQYDFLAAWMRGQQDKYVETLQTPLGSVDSPRPPRGIKVERIDKDHVKVTWRRPDALERNYLQEPIAYKVYRRLGNDGLNDRPWFPVATRTPDQTECVVDLRQYPQDVYWFKPRTERFGVTTLAATSKESELVEVLLKE